MGRHRNVVVIDFPRRFTKATIMIDTGTK